MPHCLVSETREFSAKGLEVLHTVGVSLSCSKEEESTLLELVSFALKTAIVFWIDRRVLTQADPKLRILAGPHTPFKIECFGKRSQNVATKKAWERRFEITLFL